MSGVIVKGMEMPENCFECELKTAPGENYWICAAKKKRIPIPSELKNLCDETGVEPIFQPPDFCPLLEIPTPHGRLIDADALKSDTEYFVGKMMMFGGQEIYSQSTIDNAPTIIPAEEE